MTGEATPLKDSWESREVDTQMKEVFERKILGTQDDNVVRIFAHLTILKEFGNNRPNPYEGSFDPADVDLLTFATAVDLAEQINNRNKDEWKADHWISDREFIAWKQVDPAQAITQIRHNNLRFPYQEYQTPDSVQTAIGLLIVLGTNFKRPLK